MVAIVLTDLSTCPFTLLAKFFFAKALRHKKRLLVDFLDYAVSNKHKKHAKMSRIISKITTHLHEVSEVSLKNK